MLNIYEDDHPNLLTKCEDVDDMGDVLPVLAIMFDTMKQAGGIGLAANQVGILKRFFIMDVSKRDMHKYVFINPVIEDKSPELVSYREGCLSYPGYYEQKLRHEWVVVKFTNHDGLERRKKFKGIEAIVVQHEIDHLDGKRFKL